MKELKITREFLGDLVTSESYRRIKPKEIKESIQRSFHNKHLKAYLKGKDEFQDGWQHFEDGSKKPIFYPVQQKFTVNFVDDEGNSGIYVVTSQKSLQEYLKSLKDKFGKLK